MNQIVTTAIVLSRTNYQEADRILTVITPDHGKVRLMAKGVRKVKSKLAAGVELFSISDISYILGRGEIATLTSSRLKQHFGNIVSSVDRTMIGYEFLKQLNKVTEDNAGSEYFDLITSVLEALNDDTNQELIKLWFNIRLLNITGHSPNLTTDSSKQKLQVGTAYNFDLDEMSFTSHPNSQFTDGHIKLMRLARSQPLAKLSQIKGIDQYIVSTLQLTNSIRKQSLHL